MLNLFLKYSFNPVNASHKEIILPWHWNSASYLQRFWLNFLFSNKPRLSSYESVRLWTGKDKKKKKKEKKKQLKVRLTTTTFTQENLSIHKQTGTGLIILQPEKLWTFLCLCSKFKCTSLNTIYDLLGSRIRSWSILDK